jgi:aarF domain-containing kinase
LEDECDYVREAECAKRFARELEGDERFEVMKIVDDLSTRKVLVMERMNGVPIMQAENWPQELRNEVGILGLSQTSNQMKHLYLMIVISIEDCHHHTQPMP